MPGFCIRNAFSKPTCTTLRVARMNSTTIVGMMPGTVMTFGAVAGRFVQLDAPAAGTPADVLPDAGDVQRTEPCWVAQEVAKPATACVISPSKLKNW